MTEARSLTEIVRENIASGEARLPVFDRNALEIREMVAGNAIDIGRLEQVVECDPALSSELLRVANSSFYVGLDKILTIRDAVMRLGAQQCAEIATMIAQRGMYRVHDRELRDLASQLWKHAMATALGARWLAKRLRLPEIEAEALLSGLFHDVGKLLVLLVIDDVKRAGGSGVNVTRPFVLEAMENLHGELGAVLLRQWELPGPYIHVVEHHHDPEISESELLLGVVRLADLACNRLGVGLSPAPELVLANTLEAQVFRVPPLVLAELEVRIEDVVEGAA